MLRAKVCVRLVSMSGKSHMRLVKGKDAQPEIADHEAAYRDNTGEDVCVHFAPPTRRASGWQQEAPSCWLRHVLPSALINSRHMCVGGGKLLITPFGCWERFAWKCSSTPTASIMAFLGKLIKQLAAQRFSCEPSRLEGSKGSGV